MSNEHRDKHRSISQVAEVGRRNQLVRKIVPQKKGAASNDTACHALPRLPTGFSWPAVFLLDPPNDTLWAA
jgi:hypothetical protein